MQTEEKTMSYLINAELKKAATTLRGPSYGPGRLRPTHRYTQNVFTLLTTAALFGLLLIISDARPVLSQSVQLVKVDVAVAARGYRVSKLIGTGVTNDKNEKIGTLDDIVIGQNRDLFAVLQVGGFLGINAHLIAIPYQSLVVAEDGKKVELPGASRDELKKLAEFRYRG
jgi:sporulation protein YlmC with PRC-barrel domain